MADFPTDAAMVATPGWSGALPTDQDRAILALDFVNDLRRDFAQRDALYKQIDDVIFLQQAVVIPENFKNTAVEVRAPLPMHIANSITAALTINNPKVNFNAIEFGDPGEENAAYRMRFFEASWMRQQREKKRRLYRLFMHSVVSKGEGILKTYERKHRAWAKYTGKGEPGEADYEPGYAMTLLNDLDAKVDAGELDYAARTQVFDASTEQYKRGLPYPIETTEIPPETFYYQKGEDGFVRIAEVKQVPYYDTLLRYKAGLDAKGRVTPLSLDDGTSLAVPSTEWGQMFSRSGADGRKSLTMVELWDARECQVLLRGPGDFPASQMGRSGTGLLVKRYAHGYGDQHLGTLQGPYFHAPGIVTSSREPHRANLSVLFAYLHLFPLLNALLTMQGQAAFSFSYPAYRRTTPPAFGLPQSPFGLDAVEIEGNREKIVPGAIFPHDIAPMDQPRTSVDLDKAIGFVRSMIDLALPDAVQGTITGETAGYAINQAAHLASLQWSPILDNVEDALSERVGWESRLIEEFIGETVYVWGAVPQPRRRGGPRQYKDGWIGLGPKELKGVHNYNVKLEPASINNEALKLRAIREKLDMRLISPADAVREVGGNPVEVERAWLLHELKQDPEIRKNLKNRIFQGLGTLEQEAMRELPPEAGMQAPPEAPPMSPLPGGAQPGVSQGLPTTGFVPQAGATPAPPQPGAPPMQMQRPPGVPSGAPGGVRGAPANHAPVPGE